MSARVKLSAIFLSGAAMLAMTARAQDNGRYLTDPAYLPLGGQLFGSTSFEIADTRAKTFDSTGAPLARLYGQSDIIGQDLRYGITDDLAVSLSDTYLPFDKRSRTLAAGGFTARSSSGFTDPSLGLTWRAIDENEGNPVNFDVFGSYSPDWIGSRNATATGEGNEGRGGQEGELGLAVSDVTPFFTVYGSGSVTFIGTRDTFNPDTGLSSVRAGATDWHLDLASQYRLSDLFSLNAGVGETFGRGTTRVTTGSGVERLEDTGTSTDLQLAANYAILPQSLVGSLTYAHAFDGTVHTVFPAAPANDTATRGRQDNVFGMRFAYTFN